MAERDRRWRAVAERDPSFDGKFVFAVKTTGVYCRPSCSSRRPRQQNVTYHATCAAAERAGYRACQRCRPNGPSRAAERAAVVASACREIERAEEPPSLARLARAVGMSPYYFHRVFKEATGLTPKGYAAAQRAARVRTQLTDRAGSVTQAIYDAGFNSSGRFYAQATEILGMSASAFRRGGAHSDIKFAIGQCSLGVILVAATEKGVCAILLGDDAEQLVRDLQDRFKNANLIGGDPTFEQLVAKAVGLVEQPAHGCNLPLDVRGTAFQQRVWRALRRIPAGETASYAEIARRIGAPRASRAVARACAANPIAVAIPCHRVVRNDGALSGYRWGVARKDALLKREAR
jgi:AraC family transcriptional regulator, regulatory protein of adaptative response / methylated-DNA-[protein]-cysteine methyltransferase